MSHQKQNRLNRQQKHPANRRAPPGERFQGALFCTFCCRVAGRYTFFASFSVYCGGHRHSKTASTFFEKSKSVYTSARLDRGRRFFACNRKCFVIPSSEPLYIRLKAFHFLSEWHWGEPRQYGIPFFHTDGGHGHFLRQPQALFEEFRHAAVQSRSFPEISAYRSPIPRIRAAKQWQHSLCVWFLSAD